jgi:hypothetical protein
MVSAESLEDNEIVARYIDYKSAYPRNSDYKNKLMALEWAKCEHLKIFQTTPDIVTLIKYQTSVGLQKERAWLARKKRTKFASSPPTIDRSSVRGGRNHYNPYADYNRARSFIPRFCGAILFAVGGIGATLWFQISILGVNSAAVLPIDGTILCAIGSVELALSAIAILGGICAMFRVYKVSFIASICGIFIISPFLLISILATSTLGLLIYFEDDFD